MPGPLRGPSDQRMAQQAVPEEPWYIQEGRCDRSSGEGESHQEPRLLEKFLGMDLERGDCHPSRVWGVVGRMRRGTEEKKLNGVPMPSINKWQSREECQGRGPGGGRDVTRRQ